VTRHALRMDPLPTPLTNRRPLVPHALAAPPTTGERKTANGALCIAG